MWLCLLLWTIHVTLESKRLWMLLGLKLKPLSQFSVLRLLAKAMLISWGFSPAKPLSSRALKGSHRFHQFLGHPLPSIPKSVFPQWFAIVWKDWSGGQTGEPAPQGFPWEPGTVDRSLCSSFSVTFLQAPEKSFPLQWRLQPVWGIPAAEMWGRSDPGHRCPPSPTTCRISAECGHSELCLGRGFSTWEKQTIDRATATRVLWGQPPWRLIEESEPGTKLWPRDYEVQAADSRQLPRTCCC